LVLGQCGKSSPISSLTGNIGFPILSQGSLYLATSISSLPRMHAYILSSWPKIWGDVRSDKQSPYGCFTTPLMAECANAFISRFTVQIGGTY
jgi:hypothetical protein